LTTVMAGLRCGEVSPLAFAALAPVVDGYLALPDTWTRMAMRQLARPDGDDPPVAAGASGAAGVAALLALRDDPALAGVAETLGLGPTSRVFVIATEGVTEPDLWREATGLAPPSAMVPGP
jgi:threonine dehydratase